MSDSCEVYARDLLKSIGIDKPPIRPRAIAETMNIPIKEFDAGNSYEGCLIRCGDVLGIMINTAIKYEPRKNFTIAHEIGHAEIPHHKGHEYQCVSDSIGMGSGNNLEREANEFASELLMPALFIVEQAQKSEIGLNLVKSIAEKCETSLTSSAIRYIKYCPDIAVLIVSENGKIKYCIQSDEMRNRKLFYYDLKTGLNKLSLAYDFINADGSVSSHKEDEQQIDLSAWFPSLNYGKYESTESAIALPSFNQTISLVWLKEKYEDDEDGKEDFY